ncbi:hypothetical protein [uncultured Winogradskyella sp.]|uniref:hypothetical protein n=1 Tax=uncultured Winogradskyella sp. TaxID=395353 RepID=UPI0030DA5DD9
MSIFGKALRGFGMLKKAKKAIKNDVKKNFKTAGDTAKIIGKVVKKHPKTHVAVGAAGVGALKYGNRKKKED